MHVRNMNDLIMGVALLLISAFLFYDTFLFREVHSFSFGPRVFPRIMLGITGFCSVIMILQSITLGGGSAAGKSATKSEPDPSVLIMRVGMIVLLVVYIATLPVVGYLPGTIAFLFLTMFLLGVRKPKWVAIYAVIAGISAFLLQYIFGTLLRFFLP